MKKFLALICVSVFLCTTLYAQDAVYLNNGNVLNGKVINNSDNVIIVTKKNDTLTYRKTEVRKVQLNSEQVIVPEKPNRKEYVDFTMQEKGWWCSADLSCGMSLLSSDPNLPLQLEFVTGYRFSEFFRIGAGLGVRCYAIHNEAREPMRNGETSLVSIPVFLNVRGNILSQNVRMVAPYWSFDLGYCVNDGFFYSPTLGIRVGQQRNNFIVGLSFTGQMIKKVNVGNFHCSMLSLKIGYEL